MDKHHITVTVGDKTITFETGKIARQANGSVLVRCGDSVVLSTACATPTCAEGVDFLPLRVDYQEKYSSVGRTAGGFIKREGRPTEREILVSRLIDRPLRPMFEDGYHNEVQVLSTVFSYDGIHTPDVLGICGASAALTISDIPLVKPIGAVRVGFVDQKMVINPTAEEIKRSRLDLMLAETEDAVLMIEGYCDFLTEEQIIEAIERGQQAVHTICQQLSLWREKIGKEKKRDTLHVIPEEVVDTVNKLCSTKLDQALRIALKKQREQAISAIQKELAEALSLNTEPKYPVNLM